MFAATTTSNTDILLIVAIILFLISGVMYTMAKAFPAALVSFGLTAFALAFIVTP